MKNLKKCLTYVVGFLSLAVLFVIVSGAAVGMHKIAIAVSVLLVIASVVLIFAPNNNKGVKCGVCGNYSDTEFCPYCGSKLGKNHYDHIDLSSYDVPEDNYIEFPDEDKEYYDTDDDIARVQQAILEQRNDECEL